MKDGFLKLFFIFDSAVCNSDQRSEITRAVKKVFSTVNGVYEMKNAVGKLEPARLATHARDRGFTGVVLCGGDDIIKVASPPLVGSRTALGIVPVGERRTIADALKVPTGIESAIRRVSKLNISPINLGRIADRYFFVSAGLGFDVKLACMSLPAGARVSLRRYLSRLLIDFRRFNPIPLVIKVDQKTLIAAPLLARFILKDLHDPDAAGHKSAPVARYGTMDIAIVPQIKFAVAIKKMRALLGGAFESIDGFKRIATLGPLEIERTGAGPLHADGEYFEAGKKFEVSLMKDALQVWQGS